jgi:hypothetical protein
MRKLKAPRLVTVSILTTITLIFWVFLSLYNVLVSKPKVDVDQNLLDPLDPSLDTQTLDTLDERIFFEEGEVEFTPISPAVVANPTPELLQTEEETSPTPNASESATTPTEEVLIEQGG